MNKKIGVVLVVLICGFLVCFNFSVAQAYDIYVDKSYDGDEEGISDKPFNSISDALEKVGSMGKKIYIKNGTYDEAFTLPKGVELFGQDKKQTIISSTRSGALIISKGDNSFKNLTIQGGSEGIFIYGEADISDCIIRNAGRKGINIAEDGGLVKIKDTEFIKNGKGIYAQKNSYINITNSKFEGNSEEAIDIREKVKGLISGNEIINSGEGGIEIIIGGADFLIKNNQIKKNKASGIAAQFYSQASKVGKVEIKNNTISNNGNFGFVCKVPSGGSFEKNYWSESMDLLDNKLERNRLGAIDKSCRLSQIISEDEEKKNVTIENAENEVEKTAEEIAEEEAMAMRLEKEKNMENSSIEATCNQVNLESEIDQKIETIKNENKIRIFFIGPNYSKIKEAKVILQILKDGDAKLTQAIVEAEGLVDEEKKALTLKAKEDLENFISSKDNSISEMEKRFSLFGWVKKIFIS